MKNLILAAAAVLSLGVASAFAAPVQSNVMQQQTTQGWSSFSGSFGG
jgi:hypothetical protein